jgi:hypothetical protein
VQVRLGVLSGSVVCAAIGFLLMRYGAGQNDVGKQPIDRDEEASIQPAQSNTLRDPPAKNAQLMTKDQDLSFEPNS